MEYNPINTSLCQNGTLRMSKNKETARKKARVAAATNQEYFTKYIAPVARPKAMNEIAFSFTLVSLPTPSSNFNVAKLSHGNMAHPRQSAEVGVTTLKPSLETAHSTNTIAK